MRSVVNVTAPETRMPLYRMRSTSVRHRGVDRNFRQLDFRRWIVPYPLTIVSEARAAVDAPSIALHDSSPEAGREAFKRGFALPTFAGLNRRVDIKPPPETVRSGPLIDIVKGGPHTEGVVEGVPGSVRALTPRA
jgi:hypothetical protein